MSELEPRELLESLSEQWTDKDNQEGPSEKFFVTGKGLHTYEKIYFKKCFRTWQIDDRFSLFVSRKNVFVVDLLNGYQARLKIIDQSNSNINLDHDLRIRLIWPNSGVCGYFCLFFLTDKETQNSFLTVVKLSLIKQEFIICLAHPTQIQFGNGLYASVGYVTKEHQFSNVILKVHNRVEFYRITLDLGDADTGPKFCHEPELLDSTIPSYCIPSIWINDGKIYSLCKIPRSSKIELSKLVVLPFNFTPGSVPEYLQLLNCKIQFEYKQILRHVSCSGDYFFIVERKPTVRLLLKLDLNRRMWLKITRLPIEFGPRMWFLNANDGNRVLYSFCQTESGNLKLKLHECRRLVTSNPDTLVQLAFSKVQKVKNRNVINFLANYFNSALSMSCIIDGFEPCLRLD